jgi:hypothetical protein
MICIKPSELALSQPLRKRSPASDQAYPTIPRRRRSKRHHHGGDVCGLVVLGVDGTFHTIPTVGILRGESFFVPARTQIVVKLFNSYKSLTYWTLPSFWGVLNVGEAHSLAPCGDKTPISTK